MSYINASKALLYIIMEIDFNPLILSLGVIYVIDPSSDADDAVKDLITVATDRDLSVVPFLILISQRQGRNKIYLQILKQPRKTKTDIKEKFI